MAQRRKLVIGTAGHIDHGKTVLVKALTGRDTDRLAEEKERGISIDLGFAPLELSDGSTVGIVDVPGHENFIRNMMSGATGVDLALLVVAADDGVMPQTREHLAILDILGVSGGVVAVTKVDLVEEDMIPLVAEEVGELLEGTSLRGSTVIPVSAVTGQGIGELKRELESAAGRLRLKDEGAPARLPVDRVFTLKGIGTVVTGTLWSGAISVGDQLELLPAGLSVRVRSLQVHDSDRQTATAGERVAANLAGIRKDEVCRGDVLVVPGFLKPTYMVDARVVLLKDCQRPLRRGARIRFHHGTREIMGRIYPMETDSIRPGEERPAQLRLEGKAVCAPGDRFVIRSYSPVTTIGGGRVVDAHPGKHRIKDPSALAEFRELESAEPERHVLVHLSRSEKPLTSRELVLASGMPPEILRECLEALLAGEQVVRLGGSTSSPRSSVAVAEGEKDPSSYLSAGRYRDLTEKLTRLLEECHREAPLAGGMEKETLKNKVLSTWDGRRADVLMEDLVRQGLIEAEGKLVRLPGASASVTPEQEELLEEIVSKIAGNQVSPPTIGELAQEFRRDRKTLSELLSIAEKQNRVVRVSPELYFAPGVLKDIESTLREALREGGITVSEFRNLIGTTRKFALPLLEYFDRTRVTVRSGDVRTLR